MLTLANLAATAAFVVLAAAACSPLLLILRARPAIVRRDGLGLTVLASGWLLAAITAAALPAAALRANLAG